MRRKVLIGMLIAVAAIAAAIGGTYAIFTDTEATKITFEAGTIAIDINDAGEWAMTPGEFDDWKPGDYEEWTLEITNSGTNKAWIQIYAYAGGDFWNCDGNCSPFYDWEEVENLGGEGWNMWVLDPAEVLKYKLKVTFPQCAGNSCQGVHGELRILVVAKQWRNKYEEGYSCVALENKDADYLPNLGDGIEGIICYKPTGKPGELEVDVNAYGLTPDAYYQLDLTGGDSGNPHDGACTTQDGHLAGMVPGDLYSSGYWNWGTTLEASCNSAKGGEGVWNYAGVYGGVQADASGSISWGDVLTGLPGHVYVGIGAHVKEIQDAAGNPVDDGGLPGQKWPVILSEMDYLTFTIP